MTTTWGYWVTGDTKSRLACWVHAGTCCERHVGPVVIVVLDRPVPAREASRTEERCDAALMPPHASSAAESSRQHGLAERGQVGGGLLAGGSSGTREASPPLLERPPRGVQAHPVAAGDELDGAAGREKGCS